MFLYVVSTAFFACSNQLNDSLANLPANFGFFSTFFYCLKFGDSGALSEAAANLARGSVFFAALIWFVLPRRSQKELTPLWTGGALYIALMIASSAAGNHWRDSLTACADYMAMFFAVIISCGLSYYHKPFRRILAGVICAAGFFASVSAWLVFPYATGDSLAMSGSFYQQNIFAAFMLICIPIAMCELISLMREPSFKYELLFWLASFVSSVVSVALSFNRTSWGTAVFIILGALTFYPDPGRKSWKKYALAFLTLVLLGAGIFLYARTAVAFIFLAWGIFNIHLLLKPLVAPKKSAAFIAVAILAAAGCIGLLASGRSGLAAHAAQRVDNIVKGNDNSASARFYFYKAALAITAEHPWLGCAPNGFQRAYPAFQEDFRWFAKHSHSVCLDIMCECGMPAFLIFYICAAYSAFICLKRRSADPRRLGLALGALALFVHAHFDVDFHFIVLPLTAAMCLGAALAPDSGEEDIAGKSDGEIGSGNDDANAADAGADNGDASGAEVEASAAVADNGDVSGEDGENIFGDGDEEKTQESKGSGAAGAGAEASQAGKSEEQAAVCQDSGKPALRMGCQYIVCLLLMIIIAANAAALPGEYYFSAGKLCENSALKDDALRFYRLAAASDPFFGEYQRRACVLLMPLAQEEYVQQEIKLRAKICADLDSGRAASQNICGRALEMTGNPEEAEAYYLKAVKLDPVNFPGFYLDIARMKARQGHIGEATQILQEALTHYPESAFASMFDFRTKELKSDIADICCALAFLEPKNSLGRIKNLERALYFAPERLELRFAIGAEEYGYASETKDPKEVSEHYKRSASVFRELYQLDGGSEQVKRFLDLLKEKGY
ncbi:MAG: O-antigen ligase family protein [bacterium]|nr:O-antigen ligase family protein [bacterium]